jgi:tetratricopeptide (TPR) repeat protein
VKLQQIILVGTGIVLLGILYFFAPTVPPKKQATQAAEAGASKAQPLEFSTILQAAKEKLTPSQQAYVSGLETAVVRGDVKDQQIKVYYQLAGFWQDSVQFFEPHAYYTAAAAKLENSEKNLTFAARQFLTALKGSNQPVMKQWMADQAKELFEKAVALNPANDSLKVDLGSCYIFGSSAANPQEVMQGIQKILEVVRRDSSNMYAQLMLGIGGVYSGQMDKAIERLRKVTAKEPHNLEAVFMLAEAYERLGDRSNAIKWYEHGKQYMRNPEMVKEIEAKIKTLK